MKYLIVITLLIAGSQGFNAAQCSEDIEGLVVSYSRAVIDWNMIVNYKQAIQEMGYALQYLGAALIDCNPLSIFTLEKASLQLAGEKLTAYNGLVDEFSRLYKDVSIDTCEDKLQTLHENALNYIQTSKGIQPIFQSLYDFMSSCRSGLTS